MFPVYSDTAVQPLKVGVIDVTFKPYHMVDDGHASGPDIDVIRAVLKRIGVDFTVLLLPQKRATEYLFNGRIDIGVLFKMPRYAPYVVFGEQPLHASTYRLAVRRDSEFHFDSIEDLYGQGQIGVVYGNSIGQAFDSAVLSGDIIPVQVSEIKQLTDLLLLGRVQAVAANQRIFYYYLSQSEQSDSVKFLPKPLSDKRFFHMAISRRVKGIESEVLAAELDKALSEMLNSGELAKIYQSYGLSMHYYDPDWSSASNQQ
ncbi:substrate-binding periplasmic protein [Planctobacterium marinum]|uniref:Polar amino acid ABC transporter n=1 Tax=Planctobacterium marinum TaxID=1631968 RepID=A0AA48KQB0_9ALTE|nr:polar amino acid ABC transporter [Planctobacterium marinum]